MHFYEHKIVYICHFIPSFPVEYLWKDVFFEDPLVFKVKALVSIAWLSSASVCTLHESI
jgi:hypothetical protein